MKTIFRKNDSTASLLLFVYNHYLTLTGKDSIKLSSLLEYMRTFGKNDSAVRMALSRTVKAGLLINQKEGSDVFYALSAEGKQAINSWNDGVMQFWRRYRLRSESWNGHWYFVSLGQGNRNDFGEEMHHLGFRLFHSDMWVSPYQQREEVKRLIRKCDAEDGFIEIYGEMTIDKTMDTFLNDLFELDKLKLAYTEYIKLFQPKFTEFQQALAQNASFADSGYALPLLNELGWHFFKIASDDAVLPKTLKEQWEADEAARLFKHFREALLPHVHVFLQKFD